MVTRSALQNAASIAKNILTTEAIVAEPPEKDGAGGDAGRHARHGRHDVRGFSPESGHVRAAKPPACGVM